MKNKTQLSICEQAAISSGFLSLVLSGHRRPSWQTAKRLAEVTASDPVLWLEGTPLEIQTAIEKWKDGDN